MHILIQRRAEIALRSLNKLEQKRIKRALSALSAADWTLLRQSPNLHKLATGYSNKKLFIYRGTPKLRLILSLEGDTCTVEDIVDHDRLHRLIARRGQE